MAKTKVTVLTTLNIACAHHASQLDRRILAEDADRIAIRSALDDAIVTARILVLTLGVMKTGFLFKFVDFAEVKGVCKI